MTRCLSVGYPDAGLPRKLLLHRCGVGVCVLEAPAGEGPGKGLGCSDRGASAPDLERAVASCLGLGCCMSNAEVLTAIAEVGGCKALTGADECIGEGGLENLGWWGLGWLGRERVGARGGTVCITVEQLAPVGAKSTKGETAFPLPF
jgi:hypothetical protein